jgi:hypothetical protein
MKRLLFLCFFLFLGNLSFSATLPLKKQISFENIEVEKDSIVRKERIDISKHIMHGALIAGGVLLGLGLLESTEPCPQTNTYVNICFNGLAQIVLGISLLLASGLIFIARKISDAIQYKQAMKNKTK